MAKTTHYSSLLKPTLLWQIYICQKIFDYIIVLHFICMIELMILLLMRIMTVIDRQLNHNQIPLKMVDSNSILSQSKN
jgi:hypothetical protein